MLQQDSPRSDTEYNPMTSSAPATEAHPLGYDIQAELNRLEELILDNHRVPFTRKTLVDEEQLLDHLDVIRVNLPAAFEQAIAIIQQKEDILLQAEEYAQSIIEAAQRQAAQLLDDSGLVRQAEAEAAQIRQQIQREYEDIKQQTVADIEQMRMQAMQELEQMRQDVLYECDDIQDGADDYAEAVLTRLESQLTDMLRVVRNGRQQLQAEMAEGDNPNLGQI